MIQNYVIVLTIALRQTVSTIIDFHFAKGTLGKSVYRSVFATRHIWRQTNDFNFPLAIAIIMGRRDLQNEGQNWKFKVMYSLNEWLDSASWFATKSTTTCTQVLSDIKTKTERKMQDQARESNGERKREKRQSERKTLQLPQVAFQLSFPVDSSVRAQPRERQRVRKSAGLIGHLILRLNNPILVVAEDNYAPLMMEHLGRVTAICITKHGRSA